MKPNNPSSCWLSQLVAPLIALAGALNGQTAPIPKNVPPVLGLPRLDAKTTPTGTATLSSAKFSAEDLKAAGGNGIGSASRGKSDYLVVPSNREWSRPLRNSPKETTFVTFLIYASETTVIEIGGAWLGVIRSDADRHLQLMLGEPDGRNLKWKELGYRLEVDKFDGKELAALPVLTLRHDPAAGVFDLFAYNRPVVSNAPLAASTGARSFLVRAGQQGAWVCGFVTADENPLFEDANANGIEDNFERTRRGALLAANASFLDRKALADEWRDKSRQRAPKVWAIQRPLPDRFAALAQ